MTQTDGVYTISLAKLTGEFKIAPADWEEKAEIWTSTNGAMEVGTEYECVNTDAAPNMAVANKLTDATITFDYATKKIKVTGTVDDTPVVITYAINSSLTSESWSMDDMTKDEGAETWSYVVTPTVAAGEMQVVEKADGAAKTYMGAADVTLSEANPEVVMTAGAANLKYELTAGTEYKFTYDPATATLKVATTAEPVVYPTLYFRGVNTDWAADESSLMTENKGVYTYSIAKLSGEFKIADVDWSADNSWTSDNKAMETETEYTCFTVDNSPNMAMAKNLIDVTVTFDYATKTIKVTGTVDETPVVVKYVIKGTFSDPVWTANEMALVPESTNEYYYECEPAAETGELLVVKLEDDAEKAWCKAAASDVLTANGKVTLSDSGAGNLQYDFTGYNTVKFVFNAETCELTTTGFSGIAGIAADYDEDAEYYSLQGVRVSGRPAPGLYIVVRGDNATKEYLR